jgi:hypothetical protein
MTIRRPLPRAGALPGELKGERTTLPDLRFVDGRVVDGHDTFAVLARDFGQADIGLGGGDVDREGHGQD